jgi:glycosyltransferase involved in cell wall biosynthesis
MKIILAGNLFGQGGVQTHLYWLAKACIEAGFDVALIAMGSQDPLELPERLRELEGVTIYVPCQGLSGQFELLESLARYTRLIRSLNPDVFLACGLGWNAFLPAILSRSCRVKIFNEVTSGDVKSKTDSRWGARFGFDEVIAQASSVAAQFSKTTGWKRRIPVLPAFPDPIEVIAKPVDVKTRRVPLGRAKAAFFSRLVPYKQGFWLVDQWPQLENWIDELHIYGTGPEEQIIRETINKNGWGSRVFCHGRYPTGQAYADLLSKFDLTLLPTIGAEGAPLVLLESMACGVPFVAFDVGGIPDYNNTNCCIVSSRTPNRFVTEVQDFVKKLDQGKVDQKLVQDFYMENYAFQPLSRKWIAHLIELAN